MTTPSTSIPYDGGPMHGKFEIVPGHPITTKCAMLAERQPVDGPPAIDEVFYKRTREVRNGAVVFRSVK